MDLPKHSIPADKLLEIRKVMWGTNIDFIDPEAEVPIMKVLGYTMSLNYPSYLPRIRNLKVDEQDVYVNSFPKSGTTWMQHIVWYICTQDFSCEESIDYRIPNLDIPPPYPPKAENLEQFEARTPPRFCKTHVPVEFCPRDMWKGKVIYCYRNPKDTCVSLFHFARALVPICYDGTFDKFAKMFIEGNVLYGPWHKHVIGYYNAMKEGKPVLLVSFEDMKKDRMAVIKQVAKFLGKDISDELAQKICDATSFEAMKKNDTGNYGWLEQMGLWDKSMQPFMRKGVVGDWNNHFTTERAKQFDDFYHSVFANTDLKFSDKQ